MGRMYVAYGSATKTAAGDLIEILPAADKPIVIHSATITQTTEAGEEEAESIYITVNRLHGITSGTGGSSATVNPLDPGDAAFSGTSEVANSGDATASSSTATLLVEAMNVQVGWFYRPTPEERIVCTNGDGIVLYLTQAPADSITFLVAVVFEEIG